MAIITSRDELIDYCLRKLGAPVIQINIDADQIDDRIDEAFQLYQEYHYDATELYYWKHQLTQEDIDKRYLDVDPGIMGITRIFPISDTLTKSNMFDLRYQLRLHELYDFTSTSYTNFSLTMQHLRELELMFVGEIPIRFQRHTHKLFIDMGWDSNQAPPGSVIIAEGYVKLDPEQNPDVYNDRWLKNYCTALFKLQWGENIHKFGQVPLPGGIVLNGQQIYDEALNDIQKLEDELHNTLEIPPMFMMG